MIDITYTLPVSADRRAVIERAAAEWEALVLDAGKLPNPLHIEFFFLSFGQTTVLQQTSVSYNLQTEVPTAAAVNINIDLPLFVDPTPADDVEFSGAGPAGYDLLTIARQAIGHALGWLNVPATQSLMTDSVFDPTRLNVRVFGDVGQTECQFVDAAWRDDLMYPLLAAGTRRAIAAYPDASVVARAFGYKIAMQFVDPANAGLEDGSAVRPWRTVPQALTASPSGMDLLLAPTIHHVPQDFLMQSSHKVDGARGGAQIVAP